MKLPTPKELNPDDDLDGRVACQHFQGKSLEEAEALFRENPLYYQGDMMWMGAPAFRFYLPAAIRFIHSDASEEVSDFVAHFAGTLQFRLEHEAQDLQPAGAELAEFCRYVLEHWSRFEDGAETYGKVRARYEKLYQAFSRLNLQTESR